MRTDAFTKASPGHLEPIPEGAQAFVADPLPPLRSAFNCLDCLPAVEKSAVALGGLKTLVEAVPSTELLVESFLRREAIRSSHIEGTKTELGQLLLFELGVSESDEDRDDADQVSRNLRAINYGIEQCETRPLYSGLLRDIHVVLFEGTSRVANRPGQYRVTSARIGGRPLPTIREQFADAKFVPSPAGYIEQSMKDLDEFINIEANYAALPVLVQLALMHYQFETIHPFADGNGRIGRLAISLLLKMRGVLPLPILCLSAYMDEHREEYTDLMLAVSQRGEWLEWVHFFLSLYSGICGWILLGNSGFVR